MKKIKYSGGFTLLELAIVLVIIGLIIGGVATGRHLIRSAELKAVVSEINQYKVSLNSYRLQYNALPGDHANATDYWDSVSGSCLTVTGTGTQTCDGDGDGEIDYMAGDDTTHEAWRAWQHLANAGLMSGSFTGISNDSLCANVNYCTDPGMNAPVSKLGSTASWHLFKVRAGWSGKPALRTVLALGDPKHVTGNNRNGLWYGMALTPEEQYGIDQKIDDGIPNSGKLTNMNAGNGTIGTYNPNCVTGTGAAMSYKIASNSISCNLFADIK